MDVTLDLPNDNDIARSLAIEVAQRGVRAVDLIEDPAARRPSVEAPSGCRIAFVGVGASPEGVATHMDDLLADNFGRD